MANAFTLFGDLQINTTAFNTQMSNAEKKVVDLTTKLKALDTELKHKQTDMNNTGQSAASMGNRFSSIEGTVKGLTSQLNSLGEKVKGVGIAMTMYITAPLTLVAKSAFNAAKEFDALRVKLISVTGSTDAANAKMDELIQIQRVATGVTLDAAAAQYAFIKSLQFTDETATQTILALGKLKAANQNIDIDTFTRNLIQIYDAGSMRDLKQAQIAWANFTNTLSSALGQMETQSPEKLLAQIKALRDSGVMTREEFLKLTSAAILMRPELQKLDDPIGVKWQKQMIEMRYALSKFGDVLSAAALPLMKQLTVAIGIAAYAFSQLTPEMQNNIIMWGALAAAAGPALVLVGYGIQALAKSVSLLLAPIWILGKALFFVIEGWGEFAAITASVATTISAAMTGAVDALAASLGIVGAIIASTTLGFTAFAAIIVGVVVAAIVLLSSIIAGIGAAADQGAARLSLAFSSVGDTLVGIWRDVTSQLDAIWLEMVDDIKQYWADYGDAFTQIGGVILAAFVVLTAALKVLWDTVGKTTLKVIAHIILSVWGMVKGIANIIGGTVALIVGIVTGNGEMIRKAIMGLLTGVWELIKNVVGLIVGLIIGLAAQIINIMTAIPMTIAETAYGSWRNAGKQASAGFAQGLLDNLPVIGKIVAFFKSMGKSTEGGDQGGFDISAMTADLQKFLDDAKKEFEAWIKTNMDKFKPTGGGTGGGKGGAMSDAAQKARQLTQEIERLEDAKRKLNLTTNLEIVNSDIMAGKYGVAAQAANSAAAATLRAVAASLDAEEAEKKRRKRISDINVSLEDQRIDNQILALSIGDVTDAIQQQIHELELQKSSYDDWSITSKTAQMTIFSETDRLNKLKEARKELLKLSDDLVDGVKELTGATEKELTPLEKYDQLVKHNNDLIQKNAELVRNGGKAVAALTDEQLKAAKAGAELATKTIELNKAYDGIKDAVSQLGITFDTTAMLQKKLASFWENDTAFKKFADEMGVNVEELKLRIFKAFKELQNPTFFGQLSKNLDEMKKKTVDWSTAWADSVFGAINGSIDVFANAIANWDGTAKGFFNSIRDGFRSLIGSIIAQLMKLAAMQLVLKIAGLLGGLGSSPTGPGSTSINTDPSKYMPLNPFGKAAGGLVTGSGTGTSDSIPTMLSNGEFVIPAHVVKTLGVGFFEQLRKGQYAGSSPMPSVSTVSDNRSSSVANSNVFNINVAGGMGGNQTATMVQKEILKGLQKVDKRNR